MGEPEIRVKGKYQVLFQKGTKGKPDYGSLADVRAGDVVSWNDEGLQHAEVEKALGTKWTRRFKTKPGTYCDMVVTKSITLEIKDILEATRLLPGEDQTRRLEDMNPVEET